MIDVETSTMKIEHGEGTVLKPPPTLKPRPTLRARLRKWLSPCEHHYVLVAEGPLEVHRLSPDGTDDVVGVVYIKECEHCGRMRRWKFRVA